LRSIDGFGLEATSVTLFAATVVLTSGILVSFRQNKTVKMTPSSRTIKRAGLRTALWARPNEEKTTAAKIKKLG
jgi:hypothetical protein